MLSVCPEEDDKECAQSAVEAREDPYYEAHVPLNLHDDFNCDEVDDDDDEKVKGNTEQEEPKEVDGVFSRDFPGIDPREIRSCLAPTALERHRAWRDLATDRHEVAKLVGEQLFVMQSMLFDIYMESDSSFHESDLMNDWANINDIILVTYSQVYDALDAAMTSAAITEMHYRLGISMAGNFDIFSQYSDDSPSQSPTKRLKKEKPYRLQLNDLIVFILGSPRIDVSFDLKGRVSWEYAMKIMALVIVARHFVGLGALKTFFSKRVVKFEPLGQL